MIVSGFNQENPWSVIESVGQDTRRKTISSRENYLEADPAHPAILATMSQLGTVYATKRRRRNGKR